MNLATRVHFLSPKKPRALSYGMKPYEFEVAYRPRSKLEGKGIDSWDGIKIVLLLFFLRIKFKPQPWQRDRFLVIE